ncbi:hypothetical protein GFY24_16640 [Nocardia sp. SYP-A9097]|uniref:hypothetical protein n=1 Tax=Nocardia sp. SYP-A9097 TaxID=2663237 RepID=UPI00129BAE04|nr:hypothetical protein [Nocardia sp. SYP-A9097]MRH89055.1 hypothetical protein [Nocardia sp. SYP-A9097]
MTRERSFDDDAAGAGDEYADDAAYRIATGVARTARAGAYVTGGALIASAGTRGGPAPAIDHDSRNVSWSQANDPQPDEPSPTLTFPDLTADQLPPAHLPSGIAPVAAPDNQHYGSDAGLFPPELDHQVAAHDMSMAGFNGVGIPDTELPRSFTLPDYQQDSDFDLPQNGAGWSGQQPGAAGSQWQIPGADGSQWQIPGADGQQWQIPGADGSPWHIPGTDGQGWQLPDMEDGQGWQIPGGGLKLPGADGHQAGLANLPHTGDPFGNGSHAGIFDGIDDGSVGISVATNWAVDMHIGLDGVRFQSELQVDIAVGHVGSQLDQFTQDMGQGMSHIPNGIDPDGNPLPAGSNPFAEGTVQPATQNGAAANVPGQQPNSQTVTGPHGASAGAPGSAIPGSTVGAPGSAIPGSTVGAPGSAIPGSTVGAPGSTIPGAAGGPGLGAPGPSIPGGFGTPAPAYVAPAAPAPAAPAYAAPAVPVAAAPAMAAPAMAQPVITTPLQTTIQPDAASHPIANLLTTPGQSPLYASAANAPALFGHGNHPTLLAAGQPDPAIVVAKPMPVTTDPTVPKISVPTKTDPGLTVAPSVPVITKVPGITDPASTKLPGLTVPTAPHTTVPPVTTQPHVTVPPVTQDPDGGTTRPHGPSDDTDTHGPTITLPTETDTVPTHQPPVTLPTHPGGSDVTVPTVAPTVDIDPPTHQPTITLDPTVPTVPPTVPTVQPPVTPPKGGDAPKPVKPIADMSDSGQHLMPIADDSALHPIYLVHDAGLTSHLIPDTALVVSHLPLYAAFDHTLL